MADRTSQQRNRRRAFYGEPEWRRWERELEALRDRAPGPPDVPDYRVNGSGNVGNTHSGTSPQRREEERE